MHIPPIMLSAKSWTGWEDGLVLLGLIQLQAMERFTQDSDIRGVGRNLLAQKGFVFSSALANP
jgi:hypothetical protein